MILMPISYPFVRYIEKAASIQRRPEAFKLKRLLSNISINRPLFKGKGQVDMGGRDVSVTDRGYPNGLAGLAAIDFSTGQQAWSNIQL